MCHSVCLLSVKKFGRKREKALKTDTHQKEKALWLLTHKTFNVPGTGFEPAHLAAPPPEDGASTNFATWARAANIKKIPILLGIVANALTNKIYE